MGCAPVRAVRLQVLAARPLRSSVARIRALDILNCTALHCTHRVVRTIARALDRNELRSAEHCSAGSTMIGTDRQSIVPCLLQYSSPLANVHVNARVNVRVGGGVREREPPVLT